jgi:hypothetical protein
MTAQTVEARPADYAEGRVPCTRLRKGSTKLVFRNEDKALQGAAAAATLYPWSDPATPYRCHQESCLNREGWHITTGDETEEERMALIGKRELLAAEEKRRRRHRR